MQSGYELYRVREEALYRAVGEAITIGGCLEFHLWEIFAEAMGTKQKIAIAVLSVVKNFKNKLDMTDIAVKAALNDEQQALRWNSIVEYVRELSGDRNHLAHTSEVAHGPPGDSEGPDWALAEPKIGPDAVSFVTNGRMRAVDTAEVNELCKDFQEALEFVGGFRNLLSRRMSAPPELRERIVRRRLPRKTRQNSEGI